MSTKPAIRPKLFSVRSRVETVVPIPDQKFIRHLSLQVSTIKGDSNESASQRPIRTNRIIIEFVIFQSAQEHFDSIKTAVGR